jgi:hypothetical protein
LVATAVIMNNAITRLTANPRSIPARVIDHGDGRQTAGPAGGHEHADALRGRAQRRGG